MTPTRSSLAALAIAFALPAVAQDIKLHVNYVCNDERIFVDSCNIRDLSDTPLAALPRGRHDQFRGRPQGTAGPIRSGNLPYRQVG